VVEQTTENRRVGGSTPPLGTTFFSNLVATKPPKSRLGPAGVRLLGSRSLVGSGTAFVSDPSCWEEETPVADQNKRGKGKYILIAVLLALLALWIGNSFIAGSDVEKSDGDALPAHEAG
jgi:hypothetical protein